MCKASRVDSSNVVGYVSSCGKASVLGRDTANEIEIGCMAELISSHIIHISKSQVQFVLVSKSK